MTSKTSSPDGMRMSASNRLRGTLICTAAAMTVMSMAAGAALADAIERGSNVTTSWGELQTVLINPSSGQPQSGVSSDPNSHRYKDRGGPINFDNDRLRFERKEPDGTVLRLEF